MIKGLKQLEITVRKQLNGEFFGAYKSAFKGQGVEFTELREYSLGDPIKNIDWNASAKHGRLYTKLYEQERDLKVLFVMDIGESMRWGTEDKTKLDVMKEVFFMLALSVVNSNDSLGSVIYGERGIQYLDFKKGKENIARTFRNIDNYEVNHMILNKQIDVLNYIYKLKTKDTLIFILTDEIEYDIMSLRKLGQKNDIIYVNIFDVFENTLSKDFVLNFSNIRSALGSIFFGKSMEEYRETRDELLDKMYYELLKIGVDYVNIDTHTDIARTLLKMFNKRSVYV